MSGEEVMSGKAWRDFCAQLADIGDLVLDPDNPASPVDRAEGYRYLTRLLRLGLEQNLEARNPAWPYFYQMSHATAKIGADNPDNVYWNARISGEHDYRITVRRGTMPYFSILSNAWRYEEDGSNVCTGKLIDDEIEWSADGTAQIVASVEPQPCNWLPLARDSNTIIVRQSYLDRASERPGDLYIERIGAAAPPPPLDPETLSAGLADTARFVRGVAATFLDWSKLFREHPNRFAPIDQAMFQRGGGASDIYYAHAYWKLAPDEALVIDVTPPECYYWNIQIDNWWMESFDYRFCAATLNKHSAQVRPDRNVKIIVAAADPGQGNWLDTCGHDEGTLLLRWAGASSHPLPATRVVRLEALQEEH